MSSNKETSSPTADQLLEGLTTQQRARLHQFMAVSKLDTHEAYRLLEQCG